jgi:hypothetical protein
MPGLFSRFAFLLFLLMSAATAALAQTPTFTVTVLSDPATGTAANCTNQAVSATLDANCSLRDALAAVDALGYLGLSNTQPIVNFSAAAIGSGNKILTLASTLVVSHNVNITGPGISSLVLSGNSKVAILQQANATSTPSVSSVSGMGFVSGVAGKNPSIGVIAGAAWFSNDTGVVNFLNVDFFDNNATTSTTTTVEGGIVFAPTVNLTGCVFASNTASGPQAFYGAILAASTLNISSSSTGATTFGTNSASGGSAGIVYANFATIANAVFSSNTANENILSTNGGSIANSYFASNTTTEATLLVTGTTTVTSTLFYENTGGIIVSGGSFTMLTSSFTNPQPVPNQGYLGGILNTSTTGTLTITGSSFTDPRTSGSALYLLYNTGTAIVTNSLFASSDSDEIISAGANLAVTGSTTVGVEILTTVASSNAITSLYNDTIEAPVVNFSSGSLTATTNAYNTIITGSNSGITDKGGNCIAPACTASLSALGNYGGPVQTVLPLPSPTGSLIYGGIATNLNGATTDARGYPRTVTSGGHTYVDIGATQSNYTLAFAQQPTNTLVGATISPAPSVQLQESGASFSNNSVAVTMSASAGTLSGTTSVTTNSSGVATFSNLSISPPQSTENLYASFKLSASTIASFISNALVVTTGSTAQTITFPQPRPGVVNGSATITATTTSGLPVAFSIVSGPATVGATTTTGSGSTAVSSAIVTYTGTGSVVIAANQAGNVTYAAAATADQTVVVNANYVWLVNGAGTVTRASNTGTSPITIGAAGNSSAQGGIAFDSAGNSWSVTSGNNQLLETNNTATSVGNSPYSGGGLSNPAAIAVDGEGYLWIANSGSNSVSVFNNSGVPLTGSTGYEYGMLSNPAGIAIDDTGGVWIVNKNGNSVTHVFGAAAPVTTPLSNATSNSILGAKP